MILCGTDLSSFSEAPVQAAAGLAKKQNEELLLVHAVESLETLARSSAEMQLEQEAATLRHSFDLAVETRVVQGAPDERLLEISKEERVSLVVVGALGSSGRMRRIGSVPERLCQRATVPVLIVRSGEGIGAWYRNARPLRAMLGSGLGDASRSALRAIGGWPDMAITVAHVAWPYGEHYRLGVGLPMPLDHLRPEVHHQLLSELERWTLEVPCQKPPKLRIAAGWGRIDSHLAQLAREHQADLLVVGNHRRNVAERLWHGSVSRNAIHEADCDVLCVPHLGLPSRIAGAPRTVLVPTDFSALSDRAIPVGYSLLGPGGTLLLVHVVTETQPNSHPELLAKLQQRVPPEAEQRGIRTELRVLEAGTAWLAIWQHASRENADLICMATHSRDAAKTLVLGSQAQSLLQHSRIPVMLVPPDRES